MGASGVGLVLLRSSWAGRGYGVARRPML